MIERIVHYPHPALRHRSKPIKRVDAQLKSAVAQMFELMYAAKGVGLAANQVDLPLRLFVINLAGVPDEGEEFVFLNPVVVKASGNDEQEEGCLSLPGLVAMVRRPEIVRVEGYNLAGEKLALELDGLFARAFQHELDHLDGTLFIDRLNEVSRMEVREALDELAEDFETLRKMGSVPSDEQLQRRLAELEGMYC